MVTGATYQSTRKGELHFRITHSTINLGSKVWVKHYFNSFLEAGTERYLYKSLVEASHELNTKCNVYAVVHSILKV